MCVCVIQLIRLAVEREQKRPKEQEKTKKKKEEEEEENLTNWPLCLVCVSSVITSLGCRKRREKSREE